MDDTFEAIVEQANPEMQTLARQAKAIILDIMPDAVEVAWFKQSIISYGVGPKKMSEHFCYIGLFKNHMNLGFYYGSDLSDPENLLEGTGKNLRHIKVTKSEQLEDPALRDLIVSASKHLPKLKTS